ncbi:MAG TPA: hypothetical protein VFB12_20380 [Ktedonobacteraceae bacterium]|nr:hypothetical protein [Ktedonobacteraceae bacterium]
MSEEIERVRPCPRISRGQQELTEEQQVYVYHFSQARITAMLETSLVDEAEAEAHLSQAYQVVGLGPPAIHWFDSPLAFILAQDWSDARRDSVRDPRKVVYDKVNGVKNSIVTNMWSVWCGVRNSLATDVWYSAWDSIEDGVANNVWEGVIQSIGASDDESNGYKNWYSATDSVMAYYNECLLAFSHLLHEVFEPNDLVHFARFNELVSGYLLGRERAWLVRKPVRLCRDEQGRLHSPGGMCVQYRDGWGIQHLPPAGVE